MNSSLVHEQIDCPCAQRLTPLLALECGKQEYYQYHIDSTIGAVPARYRQTPKRLRGQGSMIMIDEDLANKFRSAQETAPQLSIAFKALTRAHAYFQHAGKLKTVSVSDVLDNGTIEATFQGVRIAFSFVPVFGANRSLRGRVIVLNYHGTFGHLVQEVLGSFTFGADGTTDLDPDPEGIFPQMQADAAGIVLRFLDAAFQANKAR